MSRENKFKYQFRFLEVGLLVNGFEFYYEFCVPINLSMRRFDSAAKSFNVISVEDWLLSDFPVILLRKLFALQGSCKLEVHHIKTIFPYERPSAPIALASSLPQSWCEPFIHLIASYFVNNFRNGK